MKYVGTYSDPKDIVTKDKLEDVVSRVSTNEDNIAMAESDIEGLQTDVGTLKTNVGNIQTALTSKQDTIVGGASTITENNLTASRALISNSSGKVAVSAVTSTELSYLDGVTSNVQTQLNGKQPIITINGIIQGDGTGNLSAAELNPSSVGLGNVDNVKQYSATNPPPYPVTSVNGKTGATTVREVPAVTTSDNGKFLRVKNGEWTSEVGDVLVFLVTLTTPDYDGGYYDSDVTADKSFAEIFAAHQNGEIVQAKWNSWILDLVDIGNDYANFAACRGAADTETELYSVTAICVGDIADNWEIGCWRSNTPNASTTAPKAPGTAAAGTSSDYARGDHVHPKQTVTKSDVGLGNVDNVSINARLNRTTNVHAADTNYTTLMARGESLNAAEVTPAVNGAIAWVYG